MMVAGGGGAAAGKLSRNRWPSGLASNDRGGRSVLNNMDVAATAFCPLPNAGVATWISDPRRKNSSWPSRLHRGSLPPPLDTRSRVPGPGERSGTRFDVDRPTAPTRRRHRPRVVRRARCLPVHRKTASRPAPAARLHLSPAPPTGPRGCLAWCARRAPLCRPGVQSVTRMGSSNRATVSAGSTAPAPRTISALPA